MHEEAEKCEEKDLQKSKVGMMSEERRDALWKP